jgi:hypothetical protein
VLCKKFRVIYIEKRFLGLLGWHAMSLDKYFLAFRRIQMPSFSRSSPPRLNCLTLKINKLLWNPHVWTEQGPIIARLLPDLTFAPSLLSYTQLNHVEASFVLQLT